MKEEIIVENNNKTLPKLSFVKPGNVKPLFDLGRSLKDDYKNIILDPNTHDDLWERTLIDLYDKTPLQDEQFVILGALASSFEDRNAMTDFICQISDISRKKYSRLKSKYGILVGYNPFIINDKPATLKSHFNKIFYRGLLGTFFCLIGSIIGLCLSVGLFLRAVFDIAYTPIQLVKSLINTVVDIRKDSNKTKDDIPTKSDTSLNQSQCQVQER